MGTRCSPGSGARVPSPSSGQSSEEGELACRWGVKERESGLRAALPPLVLAAAAVTPARKAGQEPPALERVPLLSDLCLSCWLFGKCGSTGTRRIAFALQRGGKGVSFPELPPPSFLQQLIVSALAHQPALLTGISAASPQAPALPTAGAQRGEPGIRAEVSSVQGLSCSMCL